MREPSRRVVLGCLLFGIIVGTILLLPNSAELWSDVRSRIVDTQEYVDDHLVFSALIYFSIYVAVTALSLPTATMMSVIGGALFGRWLGTGLVLSAATLGATLAFWSSRYLFRSWVLRKFGHRLNYICTEAFLLLLTKNSFKN